MKTELADAPKCISHKNLEYVEMNCVKLPRIIQTRDTGA
jgi:hypothetical protein